MPSHAHECRSRARIEVVETNARNNEPEDALLVEFDPNWIPSPSGEDSPAARVTLGVNIPTISMPARRTPTGASPPKHHPSKPHQHPEPAGERPRPQAPPSVRPALPVPSTPQEPHEPKENLMIQTAEPDPKDCQISPMWILLGLLVTVGPLSMWIAHKTAKVTGSGEGADRADV